MPVIASSVLLGVCHWRSWKISEYAKFERCRNFFLLNNWQFYQNWMHSTFRIFWDTLRFFFHLTPCRKRPSFIQFLIKHCESSKSFSHFLRKYRLPRTRACGGAPVTCSPSFSHLPLPWWCYGDQKMSIWESNTSSQNTLQAVSQKVSERKKKKSEPVTRILFNFLNDVRLFP